MLEHVLPAVLSNFGFSFLVVSVAIAAVRGFLGKPFAEELLRWTLLAAGLNGILTAVGHVFYPEYCAEVIGWQTSPFQYEVGMADLAIGVLGLLAFWGNFGFRAASAIGATIWYGGDGIGHVQQMIVAKNFAPGNAGSWFWIDVLLPVIFIVCLVVCWRGERRGQTQPAQ